MWCEPCTGSPLSLCSTWQSILDHGPRRHLSELLNEYTVPGPMSADTGQQVHTSGGVHFPWCILLMELQKDQGTQRTLLLNLSRLQMLWPWGIATMRDAEVSTTCFPFLLQPHPLFLYSASYLGKPSRLQEDNGSLAFRLLSFWASQWGTRQVGAERGECAQCENQQHHTFFSFALGSSTAQQGTVTCLPLFENLILCSLWILAFWFLKALN